MGSKGKAMGEEMGLKPSTEMRNCPSKDGPLEKSHTGTHVFLMSLNLAQRVVCGLHLEAVNFLPPHS